MNLKTGSPLALMLALALGSCAEPPAETPPRAEEKVPVTCNSKKACKLFLKGRELADRIRFTDARDYFLRAIDEDPQFAMAYLYLANNSASTKEFFSSLKKAVFLAEEVSEGERLWILGQDAGSRGKPELQRDRYEALVELYPSDERVQNLIAGFYFGRQEYDQAIEHYQEATRINPEFSQPYNLMGYAFRALGRYDDAERAFEKYIELIPDEPNPYDSYAELLMKVGRHEESIANYRKALEKDANFLPSYIGIGNNQMFVGDYETARATFEELHALARHDGERRIAHFWTAVSYVFEGELESAVETVRRMAEIAERDDDAAAQAGDFAFLGAIHLNLGTADDALASFRRAMELVEQADVNDDVKANARRNMAYQEARVALARGRLDESEAKADEFRAAVRAKGIANEVQRSHELDGRLALARGDADEAAAELAEANSQDPVVVYWRARAALESGNREEALSLARSAAFFNQLTPNFAFIRDQAVELSEQLSDEGTD